MSGAVAAHAAYNGSGTQGLAVTNKVTGDDGDVASVFWNKNDTTRQLVYGSSIVEIPASGNGGTLGSSAGGNQIFSVNNDIDALGDLFLQVTLLENNTNSPSTGALKANKTILDIIKRVEFHVGTQVWQTLEHDDIFALNSTEMSPGAFESYYLDISGGTNKSGAKQGVKFTILDSSSNSSARLTSLGGSDESKEFTCVVRLPCFSKTLSPKLAGFANVSEGSYLLAGAPHQNVKIKIFTNSLSDISPSTDLFKSCELKLFGKTQVMCNAEREQIKSMSLGMPKRIKTSQNHTVTTENITASSTGQINVDLDHFSLYSSHLIITLSELNCHVKTAELKLNSSSFSGELDGALLTGATADSMGLHYNQFYVLGIPMAQNHYVFPLASQAYGASSVPLNRFDNIRLTLVIANQSEVNKSTKISVTCVGETTALYKNGAASLAMY